MKLRTPVAAVFLMILATLVWFIVPKNQSDVTAPSEVVDQETEHRVVAPNTSTPKPGARSVPLDEGIENQPIPEDVVRVEGRVINENREPVSDARVWFVKQEAQVSVTGRDGRWRLARERTDLWNIKVEAEGYVPGWGFLVMRDENPLRGPTILLDTASCEVSGKVTDGDGAPVSDAAITIKLRGNRAFIVDQIVTGANGSFQFSLAEDRVYEVHVDHELFIPFRDNLPVLSAGEHRDDLHFVLERLCRVSGQAVTPENQPVADARVRLWREETQTDGQGRFEQLVPSGNRSLFIQGTGHAHRRKIVIPKDQATLDLGRIVLEPAVTLEGRVVNLEGVGVPGAGLTPGEAAVVDVNAQLKMNKGKDEEPDFFTDDDGAFLLPNLIPGEAINVTVSHPQYQPHIQAGVSVPREDPLIITLKDPLPIRGRVVDERGQPLAEAFVSLTQNFRDFDFPIDHFRTGIDGLFEFQAGPGLYGLVGAATGRAYAFLEKIELQDNVWPDPFELVLGPAALIEGQVTDPEGVPVPGARVQVVVGMDGGLFSIYRPEAVTDGDGWYLMDNTAPKGLTLETYHQAYHRSAVDLMAEAGYNSVDFTLEPKEKKPYISGKVLDGAGRPLADAYVGAESRRGGSRSVRTDDRGFFKIKDLKKEIYKVSAMHRGHLNLQLPDPVSVEDRSVENLTLVMEPAGVVYGALKGLPEELWSQVVVEVTGEKQWNGRALVDAVSGSWRMEGIQPGEATLTGRVEGRNYLATHQVMMPENVTEVRQDLSFHAGFTLSGQVSRNGMPWPGLSLSVQVQNDGNVNARTITDEHGFYKLEGLRDGEYRLYVRSAVHHRVHSQTVVLSQDMVLPLNIVTGPVAVTVVREGDDEPIPGVRVDFNREISKDTDLDGRCYFEDVPRGSYWVMVEAPDHQYFRQQMILTHETFEEHVLSLTPTAGLTLQVALSDGRRPDRVFVRYRAGAHERGFSEELRVRENGVAYLGIGKGVWHLVVAYHRDGKLEMAFLTDVAAPGDLVQVQLQKAASLEVRVPDLDPDLKGVTMKIIDQTGEIVSIFGAWRNGVFSVKMIPGVWNLEVQAPDGRIWTGQVTLKPEAVEVITL